MSNNDTSRISRTDLERLNAMVDAEIDYTDIPPLTEAFFQRAQLVLPHGVILDPDVLAWFKQHDGNYTAHINQVLRQYIALQDHVAEHR